MKDLFFDQTQTHDLDWNKSKLRMGPIHPNNKTQINEGLRYMSPESIRNRFLGVKKAFSETELDYLTHLDGWNHYALGIEEREKPGRGIALGRLVRSESDTKEAEIAIVIIDEYQGMGLGTLIIRLLALAAKERDIERLTFTTLPQNSHILSLIHKIGPYEVGYSSMDYVQLKMEMKNVDTQKLKSLLVPHLPWIDTFDSKI